MKKYLIACIVLMVIVVACKQTPVRSLPQPLPPPAPQLVPVQNPSADSVTLNGVTWYEVSADNPNMDTGDKVCKSKNQVFAGFATSTSVCQAFHPSASAETGVNGAPYAFYCKPNSAMTDLACQGKSDVCGICPACGQGNLQSFNNIGSWFDRVYVRCTAQGSAPSAVPPPAPADCSQCLPPGAQNCNQACVNLHQGYIAGTCAAPGSTDVHACCSCIKPVAPPTPPPQPVQSTYGQSPTGCTGTCRNDYGCPAQTAQKYVNGNSVPGCPDVYSIINVPPCGHHKPTSVPGVSCTRIGGGPDLNCVCP